MLSRTAARLLTGPIAFFVAFVIDLVAFLAASLRSSIRRRTSARHRR